jgi:hypothetical protein
MYSTPSPDANPMFTTGIPSPASNASDRIPNAIEDPPTNTSFGESTSRNRRCFITVSAK